MKNQATADHTDAIMAKNGSRTIVQEALSGLEKGIKTKKVRRSQFVTSVMSISEDRSSLKVNLCTGRSLDVPTSLLSNVKDLGTVEDEKGRRGIAVGEFNVSTDAGILLQQMAHEITRLSRSLHIAQDRLRRPQGADMDKTLAQVEEVAAVKSNTSVAPLDTVLPEIAVKVPFSAIAGTPYFFEYSAPAYHYVQSFSVVGLGNCFLVVPPYVYKDTIGHSGLQIMGMGFDLDAAHGTPLGVRYNATLTLIVVLVQQTT